ncbi:MAG: hypothetical protein DWQ34_12285 [Planctomycetota bacterium]|nr:MAG: hypothetical protein DWQ34_12285 [Planctomycetota bacterium]REK24882.1 MAG: hypothetical protein DWQ41_13180 [Planctomycetota bacterium]
MGQALGIHRPLLSSLHDRCGPVFYGKANGEIRKPYFASHQRYRDLVSSTSGKAVKPNRGRQACNLGESPSAVVDTQLGCNLPDRRGRGWSA